MLILTQHKIIYCNQVNWDQLFQNKNVNEQVSLLNNIILNMFSNYVQIRYSYNDRDPP